MLLIDMPEISGALSQLQTEFTQYDTSGSFARYQQLYASVTEWKFSANGDCFDYLPYGNEMDGDPTPRLVKRKYTSTDEARGLGKDCSGFINGQRVIQLYPSQKKLVSRTVNVSFYRDNNGILEEEYLHFRGIDQPEKTIVSLGSLSRWFSVHDNVRICVVVGGAGKSFAIYLYRYSKDKHLPVSVSAFSKGWGDETESFFHYNANDEMYKVTLGDESDQNVIWLKDGPRLLSRG